MFIKKKRQDLRGNKLIHLLSHWLKVYANLAQESEIRKALELFCFYVSFALIFYLHNENARNMA